MMMTAMYAIIVIISFSMISSFVHFLRPLKTLIRALYPILPKSRHAHFLSCSVPLRVINLIGENLVISTIFYFALHSCSSDFGLCKVLLSLTAHRSCVPLADFPWEILMLLSCFLLLLNEARIMSTRSYIAKNSTNTLFGTSYFHATMNVLLSKENKN